MHYLRFLLRLTLLEQHATCALDWRPHSSPWSWRLALCPSGAQAQNSNANVMVSNINLGSLWSTQYGYATAFTTGSHSRGYAISSVDLLLYDAPPTGTMALTIQAGGTTPGAVVAP